jgi:hypothetical protein
MGQDLNAIPGKQYHLSMYRQGFGNYWCKITVLEVKEMKKSRFYHGKEYSIKYRKDTSPYDEYHESFSAKHCPTAQPYKYAREVWVHHERVESWNLRVLEV